MAVNFQMSPSDLQSVTTALAGIKKGAVRALATGINKTIKTTQVQAVKLIGQKLNLKAARIKADFTQNKSTYTKPAGSLVASGAPVGLVNFSAKQTKKGVTSKVLKSSSRYLTTGAYISKGKTGGGLHVFRREYKGPKKAAVPGRSYGAMPPLYRLRTSRKTGPRIEDIYGAPEIYNKVQAVAAENLTKNIAAEATTLIRRFG